MAGRNPNLTRIPRTPGQLISTPIWLTAVLALLINFTLHFFFPTVQVFAASGWSKKLLLPMLYCAAALILLSKDRPANHPYRSLPPSSKWLLLILPVSILGSLFTPIQSMVPIDLAQGSALFLGFVALERLGSLLAYEPESALRRMLSYLAWVGVISFAAEVSTNPLSALGIPACFYAIFLAIRERRTRDALKTVVLCVVPTVAMATVFLSASPSQPLSIAFASQAAICAIVMLAALLPPSKRQPLFLISLALAAADLVRSGIWKIVIGVSNFEDITIAHRGYETAAVTDELKRSLAAQTVGLGPGGTVSLINSPDAQTLRSSGRNLAAVDDVHLLSSYLLLKFGILGLIWLLIFLYGYASVMASIMRIPRISTAGVGLMLFLSAGVANSLTAATNLFSNPLTGVFLGILGAAVWHWKLSGQPGLLAQTEESQGLESPIGSLSSAKG